MTFAQLVDPEVAAQRVERLTGRDDWRAGCTGWNRAGLRPSFEMGVVVHG